MEKIKKNLNGIILCLFEIIVGILLLISPVGFTAGIIIAAGIVLLGIGIVSAVKYFLTDAKEAAAGQLLVKGIIGAVVGAFCVFKSHWFIATFPLLTIVYGVVILFTGIYKIQWMADMIRVKNKKWFLALISAAVSILCAVIVLANPFTSTAILWMFTGASLIVEAVFDIIALFISKQEIQK